MPCEDHKSGIAECTCWSNGAGRSKLRCWAVWDGAKRIAHNLTRSEAYALKTGMTYSEKGNRQALTSMVWSVDK